MSTAEIIHRDKHVSSALVRQSRGPKKGRPIIAITKVKISVKFRTNRLPLQGRASQQNFQINRSQYSEQKFLIEPKLAIFKHIIDDRWYDESISNVNKQRTNKKARS